MIKVICVPLAAIGNITTTLNKYAEDGFLPLTSTFIPTRDSGIVMFVLGDVTPKSDDTETETIEASPESNDPDPTPGNGSAHTLPPPDIIEGRDQ